MPNLIVTGLKIDNAEFALEGTEGMTLKQVCANVGVKHEDAGFIVNGQSLSASAAASATVGAGDKVEIHRANKGG